MRNREFITQARFGGAGTGRILIKYILPNILPQVLIMATLDIGGMMLSLASLSFLGLASQPPTPEWGYMLYEGKMYMQSAPWLIWFPGLALFLAVIVFNLLGDSLRDILDPKDRE
jgi:ABC-type dipeptide/oligopeptide/nickel transport system permease subunit